MFHGTFPTLDIITDYILNYKAAARTSVTSQTILLQERFLLTLVLDRVTHTVVKV